MLRSLKIPRLIVPLIASMLCSNPLLGSGLIWPDNQLLPTFPAPAPVVDCIDVSSATGAEQDLFASLQGIVNRTQPRIVCVSSADGEGKFTWLNLHNLPYTLTNGYDAILKYRTNVTGLVVTDPGQPHTLNLATTIAGVSNQLICDPALLGVLTNAPYSLPIGEDLRGRFSDQYQVYRYLYTNYWPQCTHRMLAGLYTNLHGNLRDYLVSVKAATVWLDPGILYPTDRSVLALFLADMTAVKGIYTGWWPSEANGLNWIAQYGIPVLASDYFRNGSLFSGVVRPINVPDIPPPPPLQNKVYVALILSDGDNIQYMQHVMKMHWNQAARGAIPIGWTVSPLAAEMDPVLLEHYWGTATTNDCLISGPSGAGYEHIQNWSGANLAGLAQISDSYLQRSGLRIITIWDQVTTAVARAFATNCPTLLGLTDQSGGNYTSTNLGLRTIGLTVSYSSSTTDIISGITNAAQSWNGTAPMFIAAQGVPWSLGPSDLLTVASALDTNKYKLVRPDHLFMLYNRVQSAPQAITKSGAGITAANAILRGLVIPNAPSATAWFEWGTNSNYGQITALTNVTGSNGMFSAQIGGLTPRTVYHFRAAASNALGIARGADKTFTSGGRIKTWGDGSSGETNPPPGLTNIVAIAAGARHGLGLKNDGTVLAWGQNNSGQTNVPTGLSNVIEVAAGVQHSLALKSDGTVTAWGDNSLGQTNLPSGLSNVIAIAAGDYHNLAIKADQSVTAWGLNNFGQTNVPAGLSNAITVAAGSGHSLALKSDGTMVAWGNNASGQTNVPAGLNHVIGIAGGQSHSMALKANGVLPPNLFPPARWTADSLSGTNGSAIGSWMDLVRGKNALQTNSASRPRLYTNVFCGHSAVRFSTTNGEHLTVSSSDSPISGATNFSLVIVFRTSTPGLASSLFYQNTGLLGCEQPFAVADWALGINGAQLSGGLGAGGSGCGSDVSWSGGTVTDGQPHIAMYVRSGNTVRLYVDGVIVAVQNSLCTAARGNYDFQIGAMTGTSGFFNGDIAELQLYDRALNLWELPVLNQTLATIYGLRGISGAPMNRWVADTLSGSDGSTISNWTDVFGNRNAAQNSAANRPKLFSNAINGHKVVRFASSSSQYLTVVSNDSPISSAGSFTLVAVFKSSTPGASSSSFFNNTGILGCEQPNIVADWALCLNGTQLGAGLGAGLGSCASDLSLYGGTVTDGNPHIAIYVRSGETVTLFVDGIQVAKQTSLCPAARGNYNFHIGAMIAGSLCFNGDIAEIQLYNRALDSWEITSANEILSATYGIGGASGTVVVWGSAANGLTTVPKTLTNVLSVSAGNAFCLALKSDGTVAAWGNNSFGQTNVRAGLTNACAIAGGTTFAAAIAEQLPSVTNATFSGYVSHDLALALPGINPDGSFRISALPSAGMLYQFFEGARGSPIDAVNTVVSDSAGHIIFAPAPDETGTPYATFGFVADGFYNAGPASVTVNIGLPAAPQFTDVGLTDGNPGSKAFIFNFSGDSNATYSIWSATNLVNWERLGPATETAPGSYGYTNSTADSPQRFFRLSAP